MQRSYKVKEVVLVFPTKLQSFFNAKISFELYIDGKELNFYTLNELEAKIIEVVNPIV